MAEVVAADKAFGWVCLNLQGISNGENRSYDYHENVTDNTESRTGHLRKSSDALGCADRKRIHNSAAVSKTCPQSHNSQPHNGIISHGNGDAYKDGNKGESFLEYSYGR